MAPLAALVLLSSLWASPSTAAAAGAATNAPATIAGDWKGVLQPGPGKDIPLVFHVTGQPGRWKGTLDSPTQNAIGFPFASVTQVGNEATFQMAVTNAVYTATLSADGATLEGHWAGVKGTLPLTMKRSHDVIAASPRPQLPEPPFPYRSVDVAYDNIAGHAHLTGTLTLPEAKGPFPVVLLITGSGPQDRDETIFGHKPFLLWADYLTRRGIAVLRVDDRGMGGSTGDVAQATTADFAVDVEAGVNYLKSRPDIDPHRIGLMGHSEGGVIAPIVASRDPAIAFIVLLAGTGETGEDVLLAQKRLIETASGIPAALVKQSEATMRRLYDAIKDAPDQATADTRLAEAWQAIAEKPGTPMPSELHAITVPWVRWFVRYDPRPTLAKVRCPILAIGGSKDLQVPATENLAGIKKALAGNPDVTVTELPNLNHLLQTSTTGQVSEYATIEETTSPVALKTVGDWLVSHTNRQPR
jgi:pimeloyl-ACP methyl ester carboxylesterase